MSIPSGPRDGSSPEEFLRRSNWRTRTTPGRRGVAVAMTFASIVAFGVLVLWAAAWLLGRLEAPGWVVALPWIAPTVAAIGWVVVRPTPAVLTDDDDDSWAGYAIRFVMIGGEEPRDGPLRLVAALVFGAPVVWALGLLLLLELTGIF